MGPSTIMQLLYHLIFSTDLDTLSSMSKSHLQTTSICTLSALQKKRSCNGQKVILGVRGQRICVIWTCYILLQTFFCEYLTKDLRQQERTEVSA